MSNTSKRLLSSVLCLLVMVVINFLLPRMMPGDPVLMLTGQDDEAMSSEQYAAYKAELGLDDPLPVQFGRYLKGLATGDLGYSYHYNDRVVNLLKARIPNTLQLAVPAVVLSSVLAVLLGCAAGFRKGGKLDTGLGTVLVVTNAIPTFLLAMLLVVLFAFELRWFPLSGLSSTVVLGSPLLDRIRHLILPVTVITLSGLPGKYLMVRNTVAAAMGEKYVVYAQARGLSQSRIQFVHIFRNICPPFITLVGLNLGFMISGSMITEIIFSINGMGGLIYEAASFRDFPTLQGCLLVVSAIVIIANILADFMCRMIDPKQRYGAYELD